MTKSVKRGHAYTGNARVIEIGSGGIPFRLLVNVDHIDCIRFEETREERPIDREKPELMEIVSTGWAVIIVIEGAANNINFPTMEVAMNCYNSILKMIKAVGVPHVCMGPLRPPPEPEEAVDAVDVYPNLAGGPGAGTA